MPSAEFEALRPQLEVILATGRLAGDEAVILLNATRYARHAINLADGDATVDALRFAGYATAQFKRWQHEQPRS